MMNWASESWRDWKLLGNYVVPATVSMLLAGIYTLTDGVFVGWGAGSDALAAINVAFPFFCLYLGLGEMLGNGSAITIAYCRGRNKPRTAGLFFGNLLSVLMPMGLILTALAPVMSHLTRYMGADPAILPMAEQYALIIGCGCFFQITTAALLAVMRHDRAQFKAMKIMIWGLLANIVLDYLLVIVIPGGAAGSAWATVLSQILCCILAVRHFVVNKLGFDFYFKHLRPYWSILGKIIPTGMPSLGLQLAAALVIVLFNIQALRYGGVAAVAAYAIISYVATPLVLLDEGIALGIQPLVSFFEGSEEFKRQRRMVNRAWVIAFVAGMVALLAALGLDRQIPGWFNAKGEVLNLTAAGMVILALAFPVQGIVQVLAAALQARQHSVLASMLVYGDCCVVLPLSLFLLPLELGLNGIWWAMPVSKTVMLLVAMVVIWRLGRK